MPASNLEFPRFSELPTELRLKIWHLAITPRLVEIPQKENHHYHPERIAQGRSDRFSASPTQSTPILRVNKESSREIAPLYYNHIVFDQPRRSSNVLKQHEIHYGSIPFSADVDVLLFDLSARHGNWTDYDGIILGRVQYIAIQDIPGGAAFWSGIAQLLRRCKSLKCLYFLTRDHPPLVVERTAEWERMIDLDWKDYVYARTAHSIVEDQVWPPSDGEEYMGEQERTFKRLYRVVSREELERERGVAITDVYY